MTIISLKNQLMQFFSTDFLDRIARGCGFMERMRSMAPKHLVLSLLSALSKGNCHAIADLHRQFNGLQRGISKFSALPYLPGKTFLERVKRYLKISCYKAMNTGFDRFKEAVYEYVGYVCEGDKDVDSILDELREWIPEEEGFMKTAGERLRRELIQEAERKAMLKIQERDLQIFQMIQHLMQTGVTLEKIKASAPGLSDEVLAQLSPDETVSSSSSSSSQLMQTATDVEQLGQGMGSMNEPEASGSMDLTTAVNSEPRSVAHMVKKSRND